MSGVDDDDPTPHPPIVHEGNRALCVFLQDLIAHLESHEIRMRRLLRACRMANEPMGPLMTESIVGEMTTYHSTALERVKRGVP